MPVYCFEMGGLYRTALSFEPYLFTNKIWFVKCSGSQSFEAVPAA